MIDVNKLKGAIVEKGKNQQDVAEAIGIARSTFYRKMKNGGDFSIEEAKKMAEFIPLTDAEAIAIFFNQKVALLQQSNKV